MTAEVSAEAMPYADASLGALVLFDVLHHVPAPRRFFAEATRVLRPGGRVVLCEPYIGPLSYPVYKLAHEEPVDMGVDRSILRPCRGRHARSVRFEPGESRRCCSIVRAGGRRSRANSPRSPSARSSTSRARAIRRRAGSRARRCCRARFGRRCTGSKPGCRRPRSGAGLSHARHAREDFCVTP